MTGAALSPGRWLLLAAITTATYPLGLLLGGSFILPLLNAAPAYLVMVYLLARGRRREAVVAMLAWAALLAMVGTVAFAVWPSDCGPLVVNGPAYRDEMFHWIKTGEGREGNPAQFLPQHVIHLAAFVILCFASASAVSIFMGAVLMNYMDYYVASLARAGAPMWAVIFFGWQPWAIARVAAFATLGAVLSEPLLSRIRRYPYPGLGAARPYLVGAAAGILLDWLLKAVLAPTWGTTLRPLLP